MRERVGRDRADRPVPTPTRAASPSPRRRRHNTQRNNTHTLLSALNPKRHKNRRRSPGTGQTERTLGEEGLAPHAHRLTTALPRLFPPSLPFLLSVPAWRGPRTSRRNGRCVRGPRGCRGRGRGRGGREVPAAGTGVVGGEAAATVRKPRGPASLPLRPQPVGFPRAHELSSPDRHGASTDVEKHLPNLSSPLPPPSLRLPPNKNHFFISCARNGRPPQRCRDALSEGRTCQRVAGGRCGARAWNAAEKRRAT
jgi:hypothetical protein